MALREYRRKRHFRVTREPSGAKKFSRLDKGLLYVIHKHRASQLHYDLRLEWKGVLLSWAVPKGPSFDPTVKRMAMATEDHPLEYAEFEGVIPEKEYGGGIVMVWDQGTWIPESADVDAAFKKGDLKFVLKGKKLKGSWVLVRTRPRGMRRKPSWLLIKHRDRYARGDDILQTKPRSVISKRLLVEIARDEGGNLEKAATGDPPDRLIKNPKLLSPRRRGSLRGGVLGQLPQRSRARGAGQARRQRSPGMPGSAGEKPDSGATLTGSDLTGDGSRGRGPQ